MGLTDLVANVQLNGRDIRHSDRAYLGRNSSSSYDNSSYDNCDCSGDCSDCYCTDCNEGSDCSDD